MKSKKRIVRNLSIVMAILFLVIAMVSCDIFSSAVESLFDGGFKLAPEIATNEIDLEIIGLGSELRGYDNFPSITMFVKPTDPDTDELITGLVRADFFDVIDDNGEARPIEVFAPKAANQEADIVFVIDTTGSMGGYLSTMTSRAQAFADTLSGTALDFRLGFITFGDDIRKGTGERLAPTSNVDDFKTAVGALSAYGGADGPENQIDAIDYARAAVTETASNPAGSFQNDMGFTYRSSAAKLFILITDVGYHTPDEVAGSPDYSDVFDYYAGGVYNTVDEEIGKLNASGINVYVVAPDTMEYEKLAEETGGAYFSSGDDFSGILDDIGVDISMVGAYMITFMTNDLSESKVHEIRIAVHTRLGAAQAIGTYTSPAVVDFDRAREMVEEYDARFMK